MKILKIGTFSLPSGFVFTSLNRLLLIGILGLSGCNKTELPGAMALADADVNQQKIVVNQVAEVEFESFDPESRSLKVTTQDQIKYYILTSEQAKDLAQHLNLEFQVNGFVDDFYYRQRQFQDWFRNWFPNLKLQNIPSCFHSPYSITYSTACL